MSVAPTLVDLPPWRVPERLGHLVEGASGPDTDRVWVLGEDAFISGPLSEGLALRVTSASHGLVEPQGQCPFTQYEVNLGATANQWTVGE